MKSSMPTRKTAALALVALLLPLTVSACNSTATTSASCAYISGNGQSGSDAKLHKIVYPGQTINIGTNETATYVPCNSRNYIITDGQTKNANGDVVGDRATPVIATLPSGVSIKISVTAYWTLNQSDKAMRDFYDVCFKYQCASDKDVSGGNNFGTKGWNGMLGEDFGFTLDRLGKLGAAKVNDDIYKKHDATQYKTLADSMSGGFADQIRATLGYSEDLFCGSGNSSWPDPTSPGNGSFTCSPVRIVVDYVDIVPQQTDSSQGAETLAAQRLSLAKALYGDNAAYWLAVMDTVAACKTAQVTCVFNIGNAPVTIPVPGTTVPTPAAPVVSPTPAPSAKP